VKTWDIGEGIFVRQPGFLKKLIAAEFV
jgi:hypothetical protein